MQRTLRLLVTLLAVASVAYAGGPLRIGSTGLGHDGEGLVWGSMPIHYRVDSGPLSVSPTGTVVITNASGRQRVASMFQSWANVSTASVSFTYDGALQAAGTFAGGDARSATDLNALLGSCQNGEQSPIIFDANGGAFAQLIGDPNVIGVTAICRISGGRITAALVALNGIFLDGINSQTNYELTSDEFNQAFTHEFGHLLGLDHSQINVNVLSGYYPCDVAEATGLPLMFPILQCQSRVSMGLNVIGADDAAWISRLYPSSTFNTTYGKITGHIFYSDGTSGFQGLNVIARKTDDPRRVAFSGYSGQYFAFFPGQPFTGDDFSMVDGSRLPQWVGYYEIPVLPGTYTVQTEQISAYFIQGSSVGVIDPPLAVSYPMEFWDTSESATDSPAANSPVTVTAGQTIENIDIILNGTPGTFDQFEDPEATNIQAPSQQGTQTPTSEGRAK